ncbi:MAG: T9SS type A sorting domain-containing protein [Flavobacteriales bacterium]
MKAHRDPLIQCTLAMALLLLFCSASQAQYIDLDPSFDPGAGPTGGSGGSVVCMLQNPNGDVIVGGNFTSFDGNGQLQSALLDDDGNYQAWGANFYPGSTTAGYGCVYSMCIDANNDLIVGGLFDTYAINSSGTGAQSAPYLARVDRDDGSWVGIPNIGLGFAQITGGQPLVVHKVIPSGNDHLLVGGAFDTYDGYNINTVSPLRNLVRIENDGDLDDTFSAACATYFQTGAYFANGMVLAIKQIGSRIYVGGDFVYAGSGKTYHRILALTTSGTLIATFDPPNDIDADIEWIEEGPTVGMVPTIYIGGGFQNCSGSQTGVARLFEDGTKDTSFGNPNMYVCGTGAREGFVDGATGNVYVTGCISNGGGAYWNGVIRLLPDGTVDPAYEPDGEGFGSGQAYTMIYASPDHAYYAGDFDTFEGGTPTTIHKVARLADPGTQCVDLTIHYGSSAADISWVIDGPTDASGSGTSTVDDNQTRTYTYCLLPGDYDIAITPANGASAVGWYLSAYAQPTIRFIDNENGWNPFSGVSSPGQHNTNFPDFQIPMGPAMITSGGGVQPSSDGLKWKTGSTNCGGGTTGVNVTSNVAAVQFDYFDPDGQLMAQPQQGATPCSTALSRDHRGHIDGNGDVQPSDYEEGRINRGVWLNVRARGYASGSPTTTFGPVCYICFNSTVTACNPTPNIQGGGGDRAVIIDLPEEGLFPNPSADGKATWVFEQLMEVVTTVVVRDAMGRVVPCAVERNTDDEGIQRLGVDIGNVPPGVYFLCAQQGSKSKVVRWMIQ